MQETLTHVHMPIDWRQDGGHGKRPLKQRGIPMLRSVKTMEGYQVRAVDDSVGMVRDFYFDDGTWAIRYLVVDTGQFFSGRRVLVSPAAFLDANWASKQFNLSVTRERVKNAPGIDLHKPVSRQNEEEYSRYYGWPAYWGTTQAGILGGAAPPGLVATPPGPNAPPPLVNNAADSHLRSVREVVDYRIQGTDGDMGHVDDFVVDDDTWTIRYVVVDTRNWWLDKKVLVVPFWADRISWDEKKMHLALTRQMIKNSPPWDPKEPVNREYEARLYDYYGRPAYWQAGGPGA
jgi:hypothetical protein